MDNSHPHLFLSAQDIPSLRVRCPVHGFIRFSENERKIIDHYLFQRLRCIRQLSLTSYVYPGAVHTRFEHSLGVMELITKAFDSICRKYGSELESVFSTIPDFKEKTIPKIRQILRLVALLHDIGHTPFSHAGELIAPSRKHENITIAVITSKEYLGDLLDSLYWGGIGHWISSFVDDSGNLPPQLLILKQLISFQMDFDRTDYLIRDSLYCGVEYGKFDYNRLLESLAVRHAYGGLEIALEKGGVHVFEALILSRYQMNTQVYFHRTRRIYDHYIEGYLSELLKRGIISSDIDFILSQDDFSMFNLMRTHIRELEEKDPMRIFADRIIHRRHHKSIVEFGDHADAAHMRAMKGVFAQLVADHPDVDFVFDKGQGNLHKLFVEGDESDSDKIEELYVVDEKSPSSIERLTKRSKIISRIPKLFRVLRIYADTNGNQELSNELAEKGNKLFQAAIS